MRRSMCLVIRFVLSLPALLLILFLAACGGLTGQPTVTPSPMPTPTAAPTWTPAPTVTPRLSGRGPYDQEPPMTIDPTKTYIATIRTEKGDIVIRLRPDVAPRTVNSFVFLAREGFYDGLVFHNVRPFLIQGGDPEGTGFGDAGYGVPLEKSDLRHVPGAVGLAHPNDNPFGSSQFYIMKATRPDFDYRYTIFGEVIEGMETVNRIEERDRIETILIEEK